jgi:hypothetical protein
MLLPRLFPKVFQPQVSPQLVLLLYKRPYDGTLRLLLHLQLYTCQKFLSNHPTTKCNSLLPRKTATCSHRLTPSPTHHSLSRFPKTALMVGWATYYQLKAKAFHPTPLKGVIVPTTSPMTPCFTKLKFVAQTCPQHKYHIHPLSNHSNHYSNATVRITIASAYQVNLSCHYTFSML